MIICVIGLGRLGGNIAGELSRYGHHVRVWDQNVEAIDAIYERLSYEKANLKGKGLIINDEFLVRIVSLSNNLLICDCQV